MVYRVTPFFFKCTFKNIVTTVEKFWTKNSTNLFLTSWSGELRVTYDRTYYIYITFSHFTLRNVFCYLVINILYIFDHILCNIEPCQENCHKHQKSFFFFCNLKLRSGMLIVTILIDQCLLMNNIS